LAYSLKATSSTNENKLVVIKYIPKAIGALKVTNPLIIVVIMMLVLLSLA
jgi:hypothetical protein